MAPSAHSRQMSASVWIGFHLNGLFWLDARSSWSYFFFIGQIQVPESKTSSVFNELNRVDFESSESSRMYLLHTLTGQKSLTFYFINYPVSQKQGSFDLLSRTEYSTHIFGPFIPPPTIVIYFLLTKLFAIPSSGLITSFINSPLVNHDMEILCF